MKKISGFLPAVVWTIVILILCLMPSSDVPDTFLSKIPYFDKFVHCGIFAGFVFLWALGVRRLGLKHQIIYLARFILIAALLGLAIEFAQKEFISIHRNFDWWDWVADFIGALLGAAIFREAFPAKTNETA